MSGLVKAKLWELTSSGPVQPGVDVQFNPASLKLSLNNSVEGGRSRGQVRQFVGKNSTELSFDLIFDTAEEGGAGGQPRSVRERTATIEKFVLPKGEGSKKQVPPKVRFGWGDLVIDGIISSLSIDFELFSSGGVPLRAKLGVTIREQDAKYQYAQTRDGGGAGGGGGGGGPGSGAGGGGAGAAVTPVGPDVPRQAPGAPGTAGTPAVDRSAPALEGESAAEFAARNDLDPASWRAVAGEVADPLSLPAGLEIPFDSRTVSAKLGAVTGIAEGLAAPVEEALGVAGGALASVRQGLALTAAGGVTAALGMSESSRAECAAATTRREFGLAGSALAASGALRPSTPAPSRPPLASESGGTTAGSPAPSSSAAPAGPPRPDPRALSFGFGVPLRPRVGGAPEARAAVLGGAVPLASTRRPGDAIVPRDPATPPWVQLPPADPGRGRADRQQKAAHPHGSCGCRPHPTAGASPCRCTSES